MSTETFVPYSTTFETWVIRSDKDGPLPTTVPGNELWIVEQLTAWTYGETDEGVPLETQRVAGRLYFPGESIGDARNVLRLIRTTASASFSSIPPGGP